MSSHLDPRDKGGGHRGTRSRLALHNATYRAWRLVVRIAQLLSSATFLGIITLLLEYLAFPLAILALLFVLQRATLTLSITTHISTTLSTYALGIFLSLLNSGDLDAIRQEKWKHLLRISILLLLLIGISISLLAFLNPPTGYSLSVQSSIGYFVTAGLFYVILRWPRGAFLMPKRKKELQPIPAEEHAAHEETPPIN